MHVPTIFVLHFCLFNSDAHHWFARDSHKTIINRLYIKHISYPSREESVRRVLWVPSVGKGKARVRVAWMVSGWLTWYPYPFLRRAIELYRVKANVAFYYRPWCLCQKFRSAVNKTVYTRAKRKNRKHLTTFSGKYYATFIFEQKTRQILFSWLILVLLIGQSF